MCAGSQGWQSPLSLTTRQPQKIVHCSRDITLSHISVARADSLGMAWETIRSVDCGFDFRVAETARTALSEPRTQRIRQVDQVYFSVRLSIPAVRRAILKQGVYAKAEGTNSSMRRGAQYDERTMYSVPMDGSGSFFVLDDDKAR